MVRTALTTWLISGFGSMYAYGKSSSLISLKPSIWSYDVLDLLFGSETLPWEFILIRPSDVQIRLASSVYLFCGFYSRLPSSASDSYLHKSSAWFSSSTTRVAFTLSFPITLCFKVFTPFDKIFKLLWLIDSFPGSWLFFI